MCVFFCLKTRNWSATLKHVIIVCMNMCMYITKIIKGKYYHGENERAMGGLGGRGKKEMEKS